MPQCLLDGKQKAALLKIKRRLQQMHDCPFITSMARNRNQDNLRDRIPRKIDAPLVDAVDRGLTSGFVVMTWETIAPALPSSWPAHRAYRTSR